jgi:peptide/nickel transport system ATP-binding protein/oligopeptide transport system ATP-binding protein
MRNGPAPLLEIRDLKKYYSVGTGLLAKSGATVKAVDGVSLEIMPGETFGLVGESGCGKTTLGHCVLRLIEPSAGEIRFSGVNILELGAGPLRRLRREIQMIFQDPFSALNPRMTVQEILREPFVIHKLYSRREQIDQVNELLQAVGMDASAVRKYPHEFSGGQRQRIGIARALALKPKLIVADEPVSALDVSIQAQIVNLLDELQDRLQLTYLFISHGIPVVQHLSDTIGVMYLGRLMEVGTSEEVCRQPAHPYTQTLLASVPKIQPGQRSRGPVLAGEAPSPLNPPPGCRFHTRCPFVMDRCKVEEPKEVQLSKTHKVWCHLLEEAEPAGGGSL